MADPSPSVSESAAPSPTTTEAADPEQAYRHFIDGYVAAISRSITSGEPETWLSMSSPSCGGCEAIAEKLRGAYVDGGRIEGGQWTVSAAEPVEARADGVVWLVSVESTKETWRDGNGGVTQIVQPSTTRFVFTMSADRDQPVMREVEVQTA